MTGAETLSAPPPRALSRRAHARALLTLGLPLIGSHLAQFAVGVTDTLMVGRYGVTSLAGLVVANSAYFVLFLAGSGFAWAIMPMVAEAVSSGAERQVRRVTRMGLWLSVAFGGIVTVPLLSPTWLFEALGQEPDVTAEAARYLSVMILGLIPALMIMCLKSYLAALEHTRVVLMATLATALLNVVANYALIFGNLGMPELGVRGAAVASVVLQLFGLLWFVIYVRRRTPEYALFTNPFRPDWEALGRVFRLGWPIGLTSLAEVGLFAASSFMMGWVGEVPLAAHGIALQITSAMFMIHVGLSQAVTVRAGHAFGRRDMAELRAVSLVALTLSLAVALATMALFLAVPEVLIGWFVAPGEPSRGAILSIGGTLLAAAGIFQLVDATQVMTLGMLRGVQDTRAPMWIAGLAYWGIGIPACYWLGFPMGLGGIGVWAGLVLALTVAAGLLSWRFWRRFRERAPGRRAAI